MKQEKAFLKQKLVEFQKKAAGLAHAMKEQQRDYENGEKELALDLLGILDAFDALDANMSEKEAGFDKTTRMLTKSVRTLRKKFIRLLKARNIVRITFPENRATMEYCKIVDTQSDPGKENETIISVIKNGYMDRRRNRVIRKAEVITVLNED